MKDQALLLPFIAVVVLTVGCNKSETTAQQLDQVQAETKQAVQDLKDYTFAQKTEFTASMQAQLAEINLELDQLAAKIENSSDAAKAEAKPRLQALREKADALGKQLEKTKDATEPTWESVKAGSKQAYGELKDGFTEVRQWLSEKIAP
jgi:DNA anti-recombination protein RmuC